MYFYVNVYKGEQHVGFVASDGHRREQSQWANDCKFQSEDGARAAQVAHVVNAAREHVGFFPFSYTIGVQS